MPRIRTAPTKPAPLMPPGGVSSTLNDGLHVRYRLPPNYSPVKRFFFTPVCSPTWRFYKGLRLLWAASEALPVWVRLGVIGYHIWFKRIVTWDVQ